MAACIASTEFSVAVRQSPRWASRRVRPGMGSPTRSRAGPRDPGDRLGRAWGPRGPDGRRRACRTRRPTAPRHPDVVEALREPVGVHRRRLQARWPGHGRVRAVRVGKGGSVARGEHPLDGRLGGIGVEVAHDDPGVGRGSPIQPLEEGGRLAVAGGLVGSEVVEMRDDHEDRGAAGQGHDRPVRGAVHPELESLHVGSPRAARGPAGCCRTPGGRPSHGPRRTGPRRPPRSGGPAA